MNWIEFAKQRPKEEPFRDILVRHSSGRFGIWTSSLPQSWVANCITHWAEIEPPPKPDPRAEAWDNYDPPKPEGNTGRDTFYAGWDAAIKHAKNTL